MFLIILTMILLIVSITGVTVSDWVLFFILAADLVYIFGMYRIISKQRQLLKKQNEAIDLATKVMNDWEGEKKNEG